MLEESRGVTAGPGQGGGVNNNTSEIDQTSSNLTEKECQLTEKEQQQIWIKRRHVLQHVGLIEFTHLIAQG